MCEGSNDGSYGSGRFCSEKCSRGFASKAKRGLINQRVSDLAKRNNWAKNLAGFGFKPGYDPRRHTVTPEQRQKSVVVAAQKRQQDLLVAPWDSLTRFMKRQRVILEQNHRCARCEVSDWQGTKLSLEYHHKDGNRLNDARENVEALCPNCHSQTDTFRGKNVKNAGTIQVGEAKVSDDVLLKALTEKPNIRQALVAVGLIAQGGNYERAKRLQMEDPSARGAVL